MGTVVSRLRERALQVILCSRIGGRRQRVCEAVAAGSSNGVLFALHRVVAFGTASMAMLCSTWSWALTCPVGQTPYWKSRGLVEESPCSYEYTGAFPSPQLALAAQLVTSFHTLLAARYPALKSPLVSLCGVLGWRRLVR